MNSVPSRTWFKAVLPRVGRGVVAAAVLCVPVGVLAALVTRHWDPLISLDQRLVVKATDYTRSHGIRDAPLSWQWWFHPTRVYIAAIPIALWTWFKGLKARTIWGVVTMLVGWNLGLQAKLIVERTRPLINDPVSSAPGFSFPSGHAFNVAMMLTTALIMAWPLLSKLTAALRWALVAVCAALIVLTALDRVFLGVHFPSDVTAGVLLALGLAFASYFGFSYKPRSKESSR